jgi:serine phosphatase RsbU (regulator of sigma subunit)/ligand-binding sensor domain-containing protein
MKNKTKIISLILINFYISIALSQEIGYPLIHNYISKEYNNSQQIFSILQDTRGIMYFATGEGVMEYDGVKWRNINNNKLSTARYLAIDNSGKIYVAVDDDFGYLNTDKNGNIQFQSLRNLITDSTTTIGTVWYIKFTSKYVYFLTDNVIFEYDKLNEKIHIFKVDKEDSFYGDFIFQDIYFVQMIKKGLFKIENNEIKCVSQSDFFKNNYIFNIALPFNNKTLLIPYNSEGLFLYKPDIDTIPHLFSISDKDFLSDNTIYSASSFKNDYFILSSLMKGALLINKEGQTIQKFNENNLLQNNNICETFIDTCKNIWLGLSSGISKTEQSLDLSYWDKNAGLPNTIQSVIRFNNIIYIATGSNVYYIDENNIIQLVQNIPEGQNWDFLEIKEQKILLVVTSKGIYEIQQYKAKEIYNGGYSHVLYQSVKNPDRVFSTNRDSLVSIIYKNGKWISEGKWKGIEDKIYGIIEDENGVIWLGTYSNGVIRVTPDFDNILNPKKVQYYTEKDGFASLIEILPFSYKNKIIWGSEKGLYIYNSVNDNFEPFCELGKQFCDGSQQVYSLTEMPDGKIWISPNENKIDDIGYLKPNESGSYDWIYKPFRRIPEMLLETFYIDSSGIAWIGGSEGLYRYNLSEDFKNYEQKFNCFIRKITFGNDSLLYSGNNLYLTDFENQFELKYENNSLKFEFAAPFFDQEEKTLYSYKLEGYDKDWSVYSNETKKEYTNLYEGNYTFKVKAINVYDVESEIDIFQITILPPWYRTWWALSFYVLLLGFFIFAIVKLYSRRLVKQKQNLEKIVVERTSEISNQKEEIQTQADELELANIEITNQKEEIQNSHRQTVASINYASRIQQAILPKSNILNSLNLENFILFKPSNIVSGDFYFIKQINNYIIIVAADCTGHGVPGAFMSMLGITLLNEIIRSKVVDNSAYILDELREQIKNALQQTGQTGEQQDGMDIAFCSINTDTLEMSFAGAHNPCWIFRSEKIAANSEQSLPFTNHYSLFTLEADHQPVGIFLKEKPFTENKIQLQKNDIFYIFSDGYQSQFGGQKNQKFKTSRFKELLSDICSLSMSEQKQILENKFNEWKGALEQTDDVLVVGIKI